MTTYEYTTRFQQVGNKFVTLINGLVAGVFECPEPASTDAEAREWFIDLRTSQNVGLIDDVTGEAVN